MMTYILLLLLIILGIVFPKSKYVMVLDTIVIGFIIGLRTDNTPDYNNYWVEYNTATLVQTSKADFPGYNILMRFCQSIGLNFSQYIIVIAFLSLILMIVGMYGLSKYVPFALSLFLIYPFAHEAIQMRTFLANSIVWCALPLLLIDRKSRLKNFWSKGCFFLLNYIATTIHTLCWFYMLIAILYLLFRTNKKYILIVFSFTFFMLILVRTSIVGNVLSSISSSDKLNHWIEGSTGYGALLYILVSIGIYILVRYATKKIVENDSLNLVLNIQKFSTGILLVIPFLTYDITFDRLWRVFLGILYLMSGEYLYNKYYENSKKILYVLLLILLIVTMFLLENESEILRNLIG